MIKVKLSRLKKSYINRAFQLYDSILGTDKYIRYSYYKNGYHNPNYQFKKDQICFIHLPKTAGTSFSKMLERDELSRFINLNIHKPVSKYCHPKEYQYITILRNPVDRVWSYYQMVLRNQDGYPYKNYATQGLNIFLEKCWASRNLACRYLSGQVVYKEPTEQTLKLANENLKSFNSVLLFENFKEESLTFLEKKNIPIEELIHKRNVKYRGPDNKQSELIKRYNKYDIKMYEKWLMERAMNYLAAS